MKYDVILFLDDELAGRIKLSFVPFPGLMLMNPTDGNNYHAVAEVYWDSTDNCFCVHFEDSE